jgi:hypothetical protein
VVDREQIRPKLRRRLASLGLGVVMASTLVACGAKQGALDQPHIGGERFTRVTWQDLPRPANSKQKCYAPTDGGQSEVRTVPDTTVDDAQGWYDQQLTDDGWAKKTGPTKTVDGTLVTYDRLGRSITLTFSPNAGTLTCEDATAASGGGAAAATAPKPGGPIEIKITYNKLDRPGG